ncbi:Peptidase cysteine/serine, trypsin-like protein [Ophiocordyceps sinensis CO18]|nr:Peptidase cysteine/serine, trypsin-like protein [Ophiocordyceps sinensis CO18]
MARGEAEACCLIQAVATKLLARPGHPVLTQDYLERTQLHRQHVDFFDDGHHHLGKLWAGSGLLARTLDVVTGPRRLDWALVDVEASRQASNQVPAREFWRATPNIHPTMSLAPYGEPLRQSTAAEALNTFKSGQIAYKVGATSGATVGEYSNYRSVVFMDHDSHVAQSHTNEDVSRSPTFEHVFIAGNGAIKPFATHGDCGAVVFDEEGQVVGLVFGGRTPEQTGLGAVVLVSPIEDVFRSIKEISRNTIKDVRIAL